MSDKLFPAVQLLCGFNGTDGATSYTDESSSGRTATFVGDAQIDTAQKKWGTAAALFDGTGDAITFPDSADFNLGNGDFCIEAWVRFAVAPGNPTNGYVIASHYAATGNNRAWIFRYLNGTLEFRYNTNGTGTPGNVAFSATWRPMANRWYHVAVDRRGADLRLFAQGKLLHTGDISTATIFDPSTPIRIGAYESGGNLEGSMNGWIDDLRITVGASRYQSDFRPPRGPFSRGKALGVLGEYSQPIILLSAKSIPDPGFSYPIRISAGTVGANLTNFPVYVPLDTLPGEFWEAVKFDGGDIRVRDSLGNLVPIDLVTFDRDARKGTLFFLAANVLTASDNEWTLTAGSPSLDAIAPTNPLGRNAVWADYEAVYLLTGDLVDRTGNHNLSVATGLPAFQEVALGAGGGVNVTEDLQLLVEDGLASSSSFTLAASGTFSELATTNRSMVSYFDTIGANSGRTTIGSRQSSGRYSNWDGTNSWNDGDTANLNTPVRLHGVWNGATEKRLYVDGELSATNSSISAIGSTSDSIMIGEGGANSSYHRGHIGFVYLRLSVLSAEWIAAEYLNLSDPETFFSAGVESLWVGALT